MPRTFAHITYVWCAFYPCCSTRTCIHICNVAVTWSNIRWYSRWIRVKMRKYTSTDNNSSISNWIISGLSNKIKIMFIYSRTVIIISNKIILIFFFCKRHIINSYFWIFHSNFKEFSFLCMKKMMQQKIIIIDKYIFERVSLKYYLWNKMLVFF